MPKKAKKGKKGKNGGGKHQKNKPKKSIEIDSWDHYLGLGGGVGLIQPHKKGGGKYEIQPLGQNQWFPTQKPKKLGRIIEKDEIYVMFTKELNVHRICVIFTPDRYSECPEAAAIIRDSKEKKEKDVDVLFGKEKQPDNSSSDEDFPIDFI